MYENVVIDFTLRRNRQKDKFNHEEFFISDYRAFTRIIT